MGITLKSGKEFQDEPPKATKEVDADLTPQLVSEKVFDKSRKSEYLKETIVAEPEKKQVQPLPFPQKHMKAK